MARSGRPLKSETNSAEIIYGVIKEYHGKHGYMPSVAEICEISGYTSTATVQHGMQKLFLLGAIETDIDGAKAYKCSRAYRLARRTRS